MCKVSSCAACILSDACKVYTYIWERRRACHHTFAKPVHVRGGICVRRLMLWVEHIGLKADAP